MSHDFVFHIICVAFLLILVHLSLYIWKKAKRNYRLLSYHPVVFGVLAIGLLVVLVEALGFQYALLGIELGFGILLGFIHPTAAVSFLIALLLARPWEVMPEMPFMTHVPRLFAALAILSWLHYRFRRGDWRMIWNQQSSLLAAIIVWLWLSALFSGSAAEGFDYYQTYFIPIIVVVVLVLNSVEEELDLKALYGTVLIAITGIIIASLYVTLGSSGEAYQGRLEGIGMWRNPNDAASLIVLALPLAAFPVFLRRTGIGLRSLGIVALLALLAGLWLSQSRGAFLALACAGAVYLLFCTKARGRFVVGAVAVILAVFFFVSISRGGSDLDESTSSRLNYYVAGWRMVADHPVFGVGIGNYPAYYEQYTDVFYEWGQRTAHSSWVLITAEAGFPGLLLFGWLFISVLRRAWEMRGSRPELLLVMVGYGVAMSFLSHTYQLLPYLVFALVLSGSRLYRIAQPEVELVDQNESVESMNSKLCYLGAS